MKKHGIIGTLLLFAAGFGLLIWLNLPIGATAEESKALSARVFELRTYHTNPGKLQDLHARFRNHTNRLFVKHGMTLIGYWTPAEGPEAQNTLIYIIAHESREAAEKSWAAFRNDPEWVKARADSEVDGALVNKVESKFLNPTDYSPIR
jgi:hypothetical protein